MRYFQIISILLFTFILSGCAGSPEVISSYKPGIIINKEHKIAIVPSKFGGSDDIVLPDALETQFLKNGFNVVERTMIKQMVQERGLDFTEILNGEEYFKLGEITEVRNIVLVNSKFGSSSLGISFATMKVIDLDENKIIYSATYTQPAPNNPGYAHFDNLNDTAARLLQSLLLIAR